MSRQKKKTRRNRRAYLDDFYRDASGRYIYKGRMYAYVTQKPDRRHALRQLCLAGFGGLCALLVNGVLPAPSMLNCPYVILPYALGLCAAASVCWALGRLASAGDPLREYVYQQTVQRLPMRCWLTVGCTALAAIGQIVYMALHGFGGHIAASLLFLAAEMGAAAAYWAVQKVLSVLEWRTNSQNSL